MPDWQCGVTDLTHRICLECLQVSGRLKRYFVYSGVSKVHSAEPIKKHCL